MEHKVTKVFREFQVRMDFLGNKVLQVFKVALASQVQLEQMVYPVKKGKKGQSVRPELLVKMVEMGLVEEMDETALMGVMEPMGKWGLLELQDEMGSLDKMVFPELVGTTVVQDYQA